MFNEGYSSSGSMYPNQGMMNPNPMGMNPMFRNNNNFNPMYNSMMPGNNGMFMSQPNMNPLMNSYPNMGFNNGFGPSAFIPPPGSMQPPYMGPYKNGRPYI